MMDEADRELFAKAVTDAVRAGTAGLEQIGWADALAADPRAAISVWFEAQGAANTISDALGLVVGVPLLRSPGGIDPSFGRVALGACADVALAAGRRAVAHELLGASRVMLELARAHALDRVQFGAPIASFQAVRHRLANAVVAIESTTAALDGAWDDGTPFSAAVAKAIAGRSARTVARHAQQVLAGIGFTAEHPFHRYFRRTRVLDQLLGDYRLLVGQLGNEILARRGFPALPRL